MMLYFLVKYLHVLGAIVILGYMFGAAILAPTSGSSLSARW